MIIHVAIPSIDGKIHAATVDSLLAEQLHAMQQGVYILVEWEIGCSLIGHARNRLAKRFLSIPECECTVFVDSDISWPTGALLKLARARQDVIGATYRKKAPTGDFHLRGKPEKRGRLYVVDGLPGGFLKVSRRAFEAMKTNGYLEDDGSTTWDFFPMGFRDGVYYGEDYGFCRLWRDTGGEVFLDPSIRLRHHGGQEYYTGDVRAWIRKHGNSC